MTLHVSEREISTLVVALRAWQNELSYYTTEELRDYYSDLRGIEPLGIDAVEDLLARLQGTTSHQEGSEATVSSVSTVSTAGAGGDQ